MPGVKQRQPGFLLAMLLQGKHERKTSREYIGRGYGTDAMRVIVGYGFREMGLHRIQLSVAPFNPAGIRAYEKAGFVEEGRQRESVLHDGRWYDEVLMSILDHERAARRSLSH